MTANGEPRTESAAMPSLFTPGGIARWQAHLNGSTVGMGNDRSNVNHVGRMVVCLCRECHGKIHQGGEQAFFNKHHIAPIKLTEKEIKLLGI